MTLRVGASLNACLVVEAESELGTSRQLIGETDEELRSPSDMLEQAEYLRTLKPGGYLLACFYIAGEQKVADWLARTVMTRMGWFTPPFDTANNVRQRLESYYEIIDFHVEGAMLYFRARKK